MITVLWVFEVKQVNVQFYTWLCVHECFIIIIIINEQFVIIHVIYFMIKLSNST